MEEVNTGTKRRRKRTRILEIYTEDEREGKGKLEEEHVSKTLRELEEERQIRGGERLVGQPSE